jgi:hypothetical protein
MLMMFMFHSLVFLDCLFGVLIFDMSECFRPFLELLSKVDCSQP